VEAPPALRDETRRLRALKTLCILDTIPEERFDRITRLACRAFNVPIALVSLVDHDRQWFKSKQGIDASETSRDISFCGHTIAQEGPLVVVDAQLDSRFADNPLVTGLPNIRFYAGQPVHGSDGSRIGTLCLIDRQPRMLMREDFELLADLAAMIDREFSIEAALCIAIVEHADDAIIAKHLDGTIAAWNAGAERMFGYTAAEMIGEPITRLFPPNRLHEEGELIAGLVLGKTISHFVTRRIKKDGTPIDVSVTLSPVRDAGGKLVAVSKIARDVTETQQRHLASALSAAILEQSDDAIISKTLDGTISAWNSGAQHMFGYTAAEMTGRSISCLFPPDLLHEETDLIAQMKLGKKVSHFETRRIRKDGKCIDVSVSLSPVRDALGTIVAISKIVREMTERRDNTKLAVRQSAAKSEDDFRSGRGERTRGNRALSEKIDELVRNEQRFQTLVRLTSQVIWTTNPEGHFDSVQPGWAAFTGQSFDDYQGDGWSAAVHPDYAQPTIDEWTRCVADRRPFVFEQRVRRHDGVYRTCTINAAPVLNDDGTIREWVGVHNDITERKQQEDAIRAQEAKLRFLTESMPQIVWAAGPDGGLDYYNERWFRYTGMTLEQTQGWGWGPVLHPDDLENTIRTWNHSVQTGEPLEIEYRFLRASDDTYRWHLGRAVPLRDAHGAIIKWFGTSTDVHDYKEEEAKNRVLRAKLEQRVRQRTAALESANHDLKVSSAKLERSNRELLEFASVASHDLQEPLRKVQTFGDRLKTLSAANFDEHGRDYLNRMLNATGRMQALIQDLLAFSRVGCRPRSFVAVDLAQVTREVLSDLDIRIAETGAQVEVSDLPTIDADPILIRQLLQNLIGNALKFHKKGHAPVVRVGCGAARSDTALDSADMWAISVADQGIGFEEKYLDRIFTMFQRLHGRNEYEGTGVGLAICRKIAWSHGGDITATSMPGQGSVFTVTLPMIFDGTKTGVGLAYVHSK
jgi:two-component system CheB/CheR fusion protein